jgi:hypothetical protein
MNEQKTPEQWFQMLKEPYRGEAIANIKVEKKDCIYYSLEQAILSNFNWSESKQGHDYWSNIRISVLVGETTYLETELKPQDMISGEWYVVDVHNSGYCLVKFKSITNEHIIMFINSLLIPTKTFLLNTKGLCFINDIKSIRKATREEVLEHFPDEFQEEQKEVESELKEGEGYFYTNSNGSYTMTNDLNYAIDMCESNYTIYKATPIGKKVNKPILEPIKTK